MTTQETEPPRRNRRWLRVLLGVSLAANLLVVGLVIGAAYRFGGPEGLRRSPPALGAALYRELSREDRRAFRKDMQRMMHSRAGNHRVDAEQLAAVLKAVPFQPEAATALLQSHARARTSWQQAANVVWLQRISGMSDTERASYADRVKEALNRRARHDARHRPAPEDRP